MKAVQLTRTVLNRILSVICAALMGMMTLLVTYQVVMRYVLNNPSTWSEDTLTYSFVWMSLLGAALVFGERDHMNLSLLTDKLKGKPKYVLEIATELVIAGICYVILLKGGMTFMNIGKLQVSPTLHINLHYIYCIMPVTGVLVILYNLINIIDSGYALVKGKEEHT